MKKKLVELTEEEYVKICHNNECNECSMSVNGECAYYAMKKLQCLEIEID